MFGALVGRSIARMRGVLIGTACLVSLFQIVIVLQAASIDETQRFEALGQMMPAFLQRWLGEAITSFASFGGLVTVGYFHPVIVLMVAMVAAYAATEIAGDSESGHADLLLSRPVARSSVVTRSVVVLLASPLALAALMLAATWIGVAMFAPPAARPPSAATLVNLAAHLVAVAWCFGALALALASVMRRRSSALVPAAIAAVSLYLNNVVAASWAPARSVDVLSPFHYFEGPAVLAGLADSSRDFLVLGVATGGLLAIAYWRYGARDV